jgi:magnesium-transporting ATPase (P-type)
VGIADHAYVITGEKLDGLSDRDLDLLLRERRELIFARTSPDAKLRSQMRCGPRVTWSR